MFNKTIVMEKVKNTKKGYLISFKEFAEKMPKGAYRLVFKITLIPYKAAIMHKKKL